VQPTITSGSRCHLELDDGLPGRSRSGQEHVVSTLRARTCVVRAARPLDGSEMAMPRLPVSGRLARISRPECVSVEGEAMQRARRFHERAAVGFWS